MLPLVRDCYRTGVVGDRLPGGGGAAVGAEIRMSLINGREHTRRVSGTPCGQIRQPPAAMAGVYRWSM